MNIIPTVAKLRELNLKEQNCRLFVKLVDGKKIYRHEGNFNHDLVPGSDEIAEKHRSAWRIAIP